MEARAVVLLRERDRHRAPGLDERCVRGRRDVEAVDRAGDVHLEVRRVDLPGHREERPGDRGCAGRGVGDGREVAVSELDRRLVDAAALGRSRRGRRRAGRDRERSAGRQRSARNDAGSEAPEA